MNAVWLLLCLLWLGVASNDARRAYSNEPLLTVKSHRKMSVDRRRKMSVGGRVEAGKLADIRLAAGTYLVQGTFGDAFSNGKPMQTIPMSVTIESHTVVRQDVLANIR